MVLRREVVGGDGRALAVGGVVAVGKDTRVTHFQCSQIKILYSLNSNLTF
jgi:hypothetical protein